MPLSQTYRNIIRQTVKNYADNLIQQKVTPDIQSPKKWKFSNSADFHYGHFVGMMQMSATTLFSMFHPSKINEEELREVSEIIEELGRPFMDYLQSIE